MHHREGLTLGTVRCTLAAMPIWTPPQVKTLLDRADSPKWARYKLHPVLDMVDDGVANWNSVKEFLGLPHLRFAVTTPLGWVLKDLRDDLDPELPWPLKPYPSKEKWKYADRNYPFAFCDEATKAAFHAVLKSTPAPVLSHPTSHALNVPRLEGWLTSEETAAVLERTKQLVHRLIRSGKLKSTRRVGDAKPVYIISELEVLGYKAKRDAKKA